MEQIENNIEGVNAFFCGGRGATRRPISQNVRQSLRQFGRQISAVGDSRFVSGFFLFFLAALMLGSRLKVEA